MQAVAFIALSVLLVQVIADDQISGSYKIDVAQSKLNQKYMEAAGLTPEQQKEALELAPSMALTLTHKDGKILAVKKTASGGKKEDYNFESGKEFDLQTLVGITAKATATIKGNEFSVDAKFPKAEVHCVTKCDKAGCSSDFTLKGSQETARLYWKRQ